MTAKVVNSPQKTKLSCGFLDFIFVKFLVFSGFFCIFAMYIITLVIHHLKHQNVMNKTVRTVLQAISYILTLILGAAGGAAM